MTEIVVAQIGVGYWGPNLLRNLVASTKFKVKTVVELSENRRDYVSGLYPQVHVTDDVDEVLQDKEITAVIIATPVSSHYELSIKMLNAGKHILVEKPMATTTREIENIIEIATEKKLISMVGHTFIYNSAVRYIKQIIENGEIGDIRYIYCQRLNLGRIRSDVDALWNLAPHDISIIQYWLNDAEPIQISKHGMDYVQKGIDDVTFLNITYPDKVIANVHVSWLDPQKVRKITIVGSKKMIVYDDISDNKVVIYDKGIDIKASLNENMDYDSITVGDYDLRAGDILIPKINWKEPLKTEINHFADCISGNDVCNTDSNHAKTVVRILESSSK